MQESSWYQNVRLIQTSYCMRYCLLVFWRQGRTYKSRYLTGLNNRFNLSNIMRMLALGCFNTYISCMSRLTISENSVLSSSPMQCADLSSLHLPTLSRIDTQITQLIATKVGTRRNPKPH